jgi:putative SOS response-associated peptidase YedK
MTRTSCGEPFAIAGLWREWPGPDGEPGSFTMMTINTDGHPLMRRFHKPDDETRSVVIVRPEAYDDWLECR